MWAPEGGDGGGGGTPTAGGGPPTGNSQNQGGPVVPINPYPCGVDPTTGEPLPCTGFPWWRITGGIPPALATIYVTSWGQTPRNPPDVPRGGQGPWPFQPRWWPSTPPSTCTVYPPGSLANYVCSRAPDTPRMNSIRGCLQQSYLLGYGYLPVLSWSSPGLSFLEGLDRRLGFGEHLYCIPEGALHP